PSRRIAPLDLARPAKSEITDVGLDRKPAGDIGPDQIIAVGAAHCIPHARAVEPQSRLGTAAADELRRVVVGVDLASKGRKAAWADIATLGDIAEKQIILADQ